VEKIIEVSYALDTFYLLMSGALVMWMAAGFAMLEAGLVRAKNTTEILTKNITLYAIACVMYLLCGYNIMYPGDGVNSFWPGISFLLGEDNAAVDVISSNGEIVYSNMADFFLSGGFCCHRYVYCFWCSRGTYETLVIPAVCSGHDQFYLSFTGLLEMGRWFSGWAWFF